MTASRREAKLNISKEGQPPGGGGGHASVQRTVGSSLPKTETSARSTTYLVSGKHGGVEEGERASGGSQFSVQGLRAGHREARHDGPHQLHPGVELARECLHPGCLQQSSRCQLSCKCNLATFLTHSRQTCLQERCNTAAYISGWQSQPMLPCWIPGRRPICTMLIMSTRTCLEGCVHMGADPQVTLMHTHSLPGVLHT